MQPSYDSGLQFAYGFLARADRTAAQVREQLFKQSFPGEVVDRVVEALTDQGYLNDSAYVERFVADKAERLGWSNERIVSRLNELGVARELVEAHLEEIGDRNGDLERAVKLLQTKFGSPLSDTKQHAKAVRFLLARGYEDDLALEAAYHLSDYSSID